MVENWMFTRGTLKAHYVKDGKAICGLIADFEPLLSGVNLSDKVKCKKCVAKLQLRGKEQ